jgi:uncharacterized protein (DUF305 family)
MAVARANIPFALYVVEHHQNAIRLSNASEMRKPDVAAGLFVVTPQHAQE